MNNGYLLLLVGLVASALLVAGYALRDPAPTPEVQALAATTTDQYITTHILIRDADFCYRAGNDGKGWICDSRFLVPTDPDEVNALQ